MVTEEYDDVNDDEEPESAVDLTFECPFCHGEVDYSGGCPHFVFSFEMVNFEYLTLDEDFKNRTLGKLRDKGYNLDRLPCPMEPWARDDGGRTMPSLDKLITSIKIDSYRYRGPHGHGSWGLIVGFERQKR